VPEWAAYETVCFTVVEVDTGGEAGSEEPGIDPALQHIVDTMRQGFEMLRADLDAQAEEILALQGLIGRHPAMDSIAGRWTPYEETVWGAIEKIWDDVDGLSTHIGPSHQSPQEPEYWVRRTPGGGVTASRDLFKALAQEVENNRSWGDCSLSANALKVLDSFVDGEGIL